MAVKKPSKFAPSYTPSSSEDDELGSFVSSIKDPKVREKVLKEAQKKATPKMSLLQRIGTGLSAFETGNALYEQQFEGKKFLPEYGKDIASGLKSAFTGKEAKEKKRTYKDVLVKKGFKDREGKVDLVDVVGFGGDVLLDPSTYLGGVVGKGVKAGAKGTVKVASKVPILGAAIQGFKEVFTPEITKVVKLLNESNDPLLQRAGRVFEDRAIRYQKGTANFMRNAVEPVKEQYDLAFKTIGKERFHEITNAVESGIKTGDAFIDEQADFFRNINDSILKREQAAGIPITKTDNYMRRVASPEFKAILDNTKSDIFAGAPKQVRVGLKAAEKRGLDFQTIQDANKWSMDKFKVKIFEEDPYKALTHRLIESEKAVNAKSFLSDMKVFGRTDVTDGFKEPLTGITWRESLAPELKGVKLPEPIVKYIDKASGILTKDSDTAQFLKAWDKVNNVWKSSVYGWFPASHTTNLFGGFFQNYVAGAYDPRLYAEARKVLKGGLGEITTKTGKKFTYKQIKKFLDEYGVVGETGFFDVPQELRITADTMGKAATMRKKIASAPMKVGGFIEDNLRTPLFIDGLKKGLSPADAAKRVVQYHFDYTPAGVSEIEKNVLKRMIPFYTYTRGIVPMTINQMLLQPQKYAAVFKLQQASGVAPESEEQKYLDTYLRQGILIKRANGKYFYNAKLPFEQATTALETPLRTFMMSLTPFMKIPIEMATGWNMFRDKEIKMDTNGSEYKNVPKALQQFLEYKEKKVKNKDGTYYTRYYVNPWKKYSIENFPFTSRIFSLYKKQTGAKMDKANLLSLFLSIKTIERDPKVSKDIYTKKIINDLELLTERLGGGYNFKKFITTDPEEGEE